MKGQLIIELSCYGESEYAQKLSQLFDKDGKILQFWRDLLAGKVKITTLEVGYDFPHLVLNTKQTDWSTFYKIFAEALKMYEYHRWGKEKKEGVDVTQEILEKIRRDEQEKQEKAKQEKTEILAKINVDAPLAINIPSVDEEACKCRIEGNILYTTYKFFVQNKQLIKPYAKWQQDKKGWFFNDERALAKIHEKIAYAQEARKTRDELKTKLEERAYIKQWATPCRDPREECDVDLEFMAIFKFKEDAEKYAKLVNGKLTPNEFGWQVSYWCHTW